MRSGSKFGLVFLLIAVVGWFVVVQNQINRFEELALESRVKSVEAISYQERLQHIKSIDQEGGQAAISKLDAFFVAIPKHGQIPEVLVMIEQLGNSAGISFSSVSVGIPSEGEVPVSFVFSGQMATVQAFLDALYANVRTAVVRSQSITADRVGTVNISMQIGLIYQGE